MTTLFMYWFQNKTVTTLSNLNCADVSLRVYSLTHLLTCHGSLILQQELEELN